MRWRKQQREGAAAPASHTGASSQAASTETTPLQLVTGCEPETMVEKLREGDDGLDRIGPDGWGSLHHAASLGMRGHVEALLDAKANALLKTTAPSGSFAKGITALQVAQSVHKAGRGDRAQVIEILQLGVQANGWGDWRALKASDGQRQASMASVGTLPSTTVRAKVVASSSGTQKTVPVAKLEEAVAAAEDRVRWAMRNELASRESATRLVEIQLLEAKEREDGCKHRVRLMEEQLDAMSVRERDAKNATFLALAAKDAAEKALATAEDATARESAARRQAVEAAKEAQTQVESACARAEAGEAECARIKAALEAAEKARTDAEASRTEAVLTAQRQAEQLKAMVTSSSASTGGEPVDRESDGALQQVIGRVNELKERCERLTVDLEAADAARVAAEMNKVRLEKMFKEQAAAAAASAEAAATQASKALQQEIERRVAAEDLCLKTARDLDFEKMQAAEQLACYRAAQAAQKEEELRSRHGTAAKALAKMVHRGLGRAFGGWFSTVQKFQRHRVLLQRSAARFKHHAIAKAFDSWQAWANTSRLLSTAQKSALEQLANERETRQRDLEVAEAARKTLVAQVAKLKEKLVQAQALHDATLVRLQAAAQKERETHRAAMARPEAEAHAAKLEAEFLARQTAFYSRQLALTSRQHARYVNSVAAAVGEQRGPPIVPHAALAKAALPFPVVAETIQPDRSSSLSVRLLSKVASVSTASNDNLPVRHSESAEDVAASNSVNCQAHDEVCSKQVQAVLLRLPKQQAAYSSNALAALEVLYTSVSLSFCAATSDMGAGKGMHPTEAHGQPCSNGEQSNHDIGSGPPQQELALLAIETLQQDILSYLQGHPQSTAIQWLEASGLRVAASVGQNRSGKDDSDAGVSPRSRPKSPSGLDGATFAYSSSPRKDIEQQIGCNNASASSSSSICRGTRRRDHGLLAVGNETSTSVRRRRLRRPRSAQPAFGGVGALSSCSVPGKPAAGSLDSIKRPFTAGSRTRIRKASVAAEDAIDAVVA